MPSKQTLARVAKDKRQGKAATTQAGEFVREEIHHVRKGKHGARSVKQAIAIGLSKARRAGVKVPAKKGTTPGKTVVKDGHKVSAKRSAAAKTALKRESHIATLKKAPAEQTRSVAQHRSAAARSAAARSRAGRQNHA
ncbi:MAG: DUF6496 domain-containing protein [Pseudomonadota bacterium]